MLIQTFCNYLLRRNLITLSQIHEILGAKRTVRPSLMDIALSQGYMTQEDVEEYNEIAEPDDLFEDLAVDEGIILQGDMFRLLKLQLRDDFVLFEILKVNNIMPRDVAERHVADFIAFYNLSDEDYMKLLEGDIKICLEKIAQVPVDSLFFKFADILLSMILQTVDPNLTVLEYLKPDAETFRNLTILYFDNPLAEHKNVLCGYCGADETVLAVASSYMGAAADSFTSVCEDSLKELLNCASGEFVGELEKVGYLDYDLSVPEFCAERQVEHPEILKVMTEHGELQVIFSA